MAKATTITLEGRAFRIVDAKALTLQQDAYIAAALERAGLTDPRLADLEGPALVAEGQLRVFESGRVGEFLAGYLVEEKQAWTAEAAQVNARAFNGVRERGARDELLAVVGGLLVGFFSTARKSPGTGPSSSIAPAPGERSAPAAASTSAAGSP